MFELSRDSFRKNIKHRERSQNYINLSKNSDGEQMGKKTFARVTKTMAILLAVLFLVTVTTVSAYTTIGGETNDRNTIVIHDDKHRLVTMTTNMGKVTKMATAKALTMAKRTAINTVVKRFSIRFLIPPTKTRTTAKASYWATQPATTKKDTYAYKRYTCLKNK